MKKRVLMIAALVSGTLVPFLAAPPTPIPVNVKQANPVLAQVLAP